MDNNANGTSWWDLIHDERVPPNNGQFIASLQKLHDDMPDNANPAQWFAKVNSFALANDLTMPEIN